MQKQLPKAFFSLLLGCFTFILAQAQSGCPGCTVNLPPLPEDTVYVQQIPDGQLNVPFTEDISFRMPITTDPVVVLDPSAPPGINIDKIELISVTDLPAGVTWESNKFEFDVSNGDTDGCIRLCGTPLQTGLFMVEITISAEVAIISQEASFFLEFYVAPATSNTVGFSMSNNISCGSAMVSFENNVPGNGNPGITYSWDFGNGYTTTDEFPADQIYNTIGTYVVEYNATIDTIGVILTSVEVLASGCNDILSAPDYVIKVFDPAGNEIYTSQEASNTNPPVTFNMNLLIGSGNYSVQVIDDDGLLPDDDCGTVPFNQSSGGVLNIGDLEVELTLINPVTTIQSFDTVFVYPVPDTPEITFDLGSEEVCSGDSAILTSSFQSIGNQWYFNNEIIADETLASLTVFEAGQYSVEYTNEQGCSAISAPTEVILLDPPSTPVFFIYGNLMTLDPATQLPDQYTFQWYFDGAPVADANGPELCAFESGNYLLELTDLESGCTNTFDKDISYNPDIACTTSSKDLKTAYTVSVFPNPTTEKIFVTVEAPNQIQDIYLYGSLGQRMILPINAIEQSNVELNLNGFPSGIYYLEISMAEGKVVKKIVKQ